MNIVIAGPLVIGGHTGSEIVVIDTIEVVDSVSEEKLQSLQLKKLSVKRKLDEARDKVVRTQAALVCENADLVDELTRLEQEHDKLMRDIVLDSLSQQGRSGAHDETESFSKSNFEVGEEDDEWKPTIKISKKCKVLFGKIARTTHPDKTSRDSEVVRDGKKRIFIEAKIARDANDHAELVKIYGRLKNLGSSLMQSLLLSIDTVYREIADIQAQLNVLQQENIYRMSIDYLAGFKRRPNAYFRSMLSSNIEQRKRDIHELDNSLYPEVIKPYSLTWFNIQDRG